MKSVLLSESSGGSCQLETGGLQFSFFILEGVISRKCLQKSSVVYFLVFFR